MEHESVGVIAPERRKGSPSQLLFLWFSANMQLTTIVTGALAVTLHISLASALVGMIVGNIVGSTIMALHAAQGHRMPAPQMILSRAQFGLRGSLLVMVLFTVMYIGFFASTAVIGGQMLTEVTHIPYGVSLLLLNTLAALLVYYGQEVIHRFQRISAYLFLTLFIYLSATLVAHLVVAHAGPHESFSWPGVLAMASIAITWQISYTPYVSDYSRHLQAATPTWKPFLYASLGTVTSTTWMMILGGLAAWTGVNPAHIGNGTFLVVYAAPALQWTVYTLLLLGIIAVNVFNLYGGFMSTLALLPPTRIRLDQRRILVLIALGAVCTAIAVWGTGNFLDKYAVFLSLLLYFLIPWSAINLTDFYIVRKAHYDPDGLLGSRPTYGRYNWPTLGVYATAVACEFTLLRWSAHSLLHNLAWLAGFVVSAVLYYTVSRRYAEPSSEVPKTAH